MSLYDRLDLTRPTRKLQVPLSQRLNLTRQRLPRCLGCRVRIQSHWQFCPTCGRTLIVHDGEFRRCIWVDMLGMNISLENKQADHLIIDAFSKVYGAFRSVKVFLTSEPPEQKEWDSDFTHVYVFADNQPVDYLGVASFKLGVVTDFAIIRIDQILNASYFASLSFNQLSNLIANTIAHEIGHTLGLAHSALPTDVMHDGLNHTIHSFIPPSFHVEQINSMNNAIRKYKALKASI